METVTHHLCWEAARQGCYGWNSSPFLRDWLSRQDTGAYYEFSVEYQWASHLAKLQSNVATGLSDHIPWVYIETDGGNGREACFLESSLVSNQATANHSILSVFHLLPPPSPHHDPTGKTYTLPLSCNFRHYCQPPKPVAPGGKTLNLKNKTKAKQT